MIKDYKQGCISDSLSSTTHLINMARQMSSNITSAPENSFIIKMAYNSISFLRYLINQPQI